MAQYEHLMYMAAIGILKKFDNEIMPFCRSKGGKGGVYSLFRTGIELVAGDTAKLQWMTLDDLKSRFGAGSMGPEYDNMDSGTSFIIAIECIDAEGKSRFKTLGFQDDQGPNDVDPLIEYLTFKTKTKCRGCGKRGAPVYRCKSCNVFVWYCNPTCRDMDAVNHAYLYGK